MTGLRPLALCALLTATLPAVAQVKDLGPASELYKKNSKFRFVPGPKQSGGEIKWTAKGKVEVEKDEYALLENDVHVDYQDIKLQADKVTVNLKTKDVVAEGHVIIDQGPTRLTADHAVYNLDSKTGTLFKATGTMDPSLYFSGDKIEKLDVDTYRLTEGTFTSCDIDRPAWSFHVGEATVTVDDYAHMKDLTFRAHKLPIFWLPRLVWPTKSERSQGVLIPRILRSSEYGERLEIGYFIPFGESADATLYADINAQGYHGLGTAVRYLPSENVKLGELNAYTVRDVSGDEAKQQWKYAYKHAQENLPGGFRGVVDVQDFSDLDFFRKYDRDPRIFTLSNIYSSAYLTKNRPTYSLNILADRRDIILGRAVFGDPNSPILKQRFEQLPSLQFRMYPQRVFGSPLYFSLESSTAHLRTSGLINGPTADYYRTDLFPTMSLQLRTPAWFSIKPQISVRQTFYSSSLSEASAENPGTPQVAVDEALRRFYAQGQVELVGPSFSKVYNRSLGGFSKFKHVIEPRFRYLYTTSVDDQNRVIRFDTVDSPFLPIVRDSVEYSLTQRIIAKEAGPDGNARDILSFSLRQTASLSKPFTNATGGGTGTFVGLRNKFTPLTANLHVNPYQSLTLDANATFGSASHQLDQTSLSANLVGTGRQSDKYLSFTWFATTQAPDTTFDTRTSQFRINTGSQLWRDRMRADVQLNFDAKKGTFLEQRYLIGANGSCYGVAFEYRRYLVYDPLQHALSSIGIAVTLKNVGTIGTH
jgi:LPS-assembly protein